MMTKGLTSFVLKHITSQRSIGFFKSVRKTREAVGESSGHRGRRERPAESEARGPTPPAPPGLQSRPPAALSPPAADRPAVQPARPVGPEQLLCSRRFHCCGLGQHPAVPDQDLSHLNEEQRVSVEGPRRPWLGCGMLSTNSRQDPPPADRL